MSSDSDLDFLKIVIPSKKQTANLKERDTKPEKQKEKDQEGEKKPEKQREKDYNKRMFSTNEDDEEEEEEEKKKKKKVKIAKSDDDEEDDRLATRIKKIIAKAATKNLKTGKPEGKKGKSFSITIISNILRWYMFCIELL